MKLLLVGASGTIGNAIIKEIGTDCEIIRAGRNGADVEVDFTSPESIKKMYESVGKVDAVISAAGRAQFAPLEELTPELNETGIMSKLKGQVNLVLLGIPFVNDGGSFTLTSGVMMDDPILKGASAAMANGGIQAFVRASAIEMPRGIRINNVSPNVLIESMDKYAEFFQGFKPVAAADAALAYKKSVLGAQTGQTYKVY